MGPDLMLYALISADPSCFTTWYERCSKSDASAVLRDYLSVSAGSIGQAVGKVAHAFRQPQPSFALHLVNLGGDCMKLTMPGPPGLLDAAFNVGVRACDLLHQTEHGWYNSYRNDVLCRALKAAKIITSDDDVFCLTREKHNGFYALGYLPKAGAGVAAGGAAAGGAAADTGAGAVGGSAATKGSCSYELGCKVDSEGLCTFGLALDSPAAAAKVTHSESSALGGGRLFKPGGKQPGPEQTGGAAKNPDGGGAAPGAR